MLFFLNLGAPQPAKGYKSLLAFWSGGASGGEVVAPPADDTVTGGSVNYRIRRSQQAQLARAIADNLSDRLKKPAERPAPEPVRVQPELAEVFRLDADALARLRADERAEAERLIAQGLDEEAALLVTLLLLSA